MLQRAKREIDNTLLKDEKYIIYFSYYRYMMQEEIFSLFHCTSKIGDHITTINNTVQKAKYQINNALLKD